MNDLPEQKISVDPEQEKGPTPVLGILSTIFGGLSMIPLMGVVSPLGLVLGIIGLFREQKKLMSIIGTSVSALGIATSPILWGLVICMFNMEECQKQAEERQKERSAIEYRIDHG